MTAKGKNSTAGWTWLRWLLAAAFVVAVVASGLFSGLMNGMGLLYILFGSAAAALMGFSGGEIGTAFRQAAGAVPAEGGSAGSAYFWEAAARNAWILGALGSAINFTIVLGTGSDEIAGVANRMIESFLVFLYGLVLAVVCLIPATKLSGQAERTAVRGADAAAAGPSRSSRAGARTAPFERAVGYVLFAAVVGLNVFFAIGGRRASGPLPIGKVLLHWPAILVVVGGSVVLALFMGARAGARAWTAGFAMTGLVGLLAGFIQGLFGFVHRNVPEIAAACAFIISASSFSLLGLVAVAAPLEDREVMEGRRDKAASLSRLFWAVFPLVTFFFLVLTFIMVVTPMTKPGG
jgi:hypothetical protein